MSEFKIETGVPVPDMGSGLSKIISRLELGESFFIPKAGRYEW